MVHGRVKDHPILSGLAVLIILGVLAALALNFTQGTFTAPTDNCEWATVKHPDNDEQYTSTSSYFSDYQSINELDDSQIQSYRESIDTRFRDVDNDGRNELQVKIKECISGSFSGEAPSN